MRAFGFFVSLFCFCFSVNAEVVQQEQLQHYQVSLSKGQSLRLALRNASPITRDGVVRFGQTEWSITPDYGYRQFSGSCYVSRSQVNLSLKLTLPKLTSTAPAPMQQQFQLFYQALHQHELGHRKLAIEAAQKIDEILNQREIFSDCHTLHEEIKQDIGAVIDKYKRLNQRYDASTQYGKTQGAVIREIQIQKSTENN